MARQESEREDLLRDATALIERIEIVVSLDENEQPQHVVVGFRRDGCASIYFGADPVFHFNTRGQLRRAFVEDELLKAQRGQLVALRRVRTGGEVQLHSRALSDAETEVLLQQLSDRRKALLERLCAGELDVVGQVPADADVPGRVKGWLEGMSEISIAVSPHAR